MDTFSFGGRVLWTAAALTILGFAFTWADPPAALSFEVFTTLLGIAIALSLTGLELLGAPLAAALALVPTLTFFFSFLTLVPAVLACVGGVIRWSGRQRRLGKAGAAPG